MYAYTYTCIYTYTIHTHIPPPYITQKVDDFVDKVKGSRKRPNAYFGYAVSSILRILHINYTYYP
jgi:hypothetical protein